MHYTNLIKLNILNLYSRISIFNEEINYFILALIKLTNSQNLSNSYFTLIWIIQKFVDKSDKEIKNILLQNS